MAGKELIRTEGAPAAIGPYSQAVRQGDWLFCSGQVALDPKSGEMVGDDVTSQSRQVLTNLKAVVEAAGGSLRDIVKTTVFLKDMNDFQAMNAIYGEFFDQEPPARAAVQAARLPKDAIVEIEAIAFLG
ncbi:MAG: RidA family protein [Planctomycetota bacterium]